jgi:alanine or glycine:cation symporter, AGCS family
MITFEIITNYILFASCLFILLGSIYLSLKTRFVQIRMIPVLFRMVKSIFLAKAKKETEYTILPHKALLTAMSTTIGVSTIVAPVIAISLGGPGALLGFLFTAFFGAAATYTEVNLSIRYRKKLEDGRIMGGPMQYLKALLSPVIANWYAFTCFLLMAAWSSAQANQLASILNSPLLGAFKIPTYLSGILIAFLTVMVLIGGIKRISSLSSKLVPIMFVLYLSSSFWIILSNTHLLGSILAEIIQSAFSPYALASGALVGGLVHSLRWGIFKGIQTCEAGIGSQAIPHSMAETNDPDSQGALAMLSTYTAGLIAFLSGLVAMITKTWLNPDLSLGINMVAASFELYFSTFGIIIVIIGTLLFAFGTILGNCYNGSQCFSYLTKNRWLSAYVIGTAVMIFFGSIAEVKTVWSYIDIVLALVVVPHMGALIIYSYRQSANTKTNEKAIEPEALMIQAD